MEFTVSANWRIFKRINGESETVQVGTITYPMQGDVCDLKGAGKMAEMSVAKKYNVDISHVIAEVNTIFIRPEPVARTIVTVTPVSHAPSMLAGALVTAVIILSLSLLVSAVISSRKPTKKKER